MLTTNTVYVPRPEHEPRPSFRRGIYGKALFNPMGIITPVFSFYEVLGVLIMETYSPKMIEGQVRQVENVGDLESSKEKHPDATIPAADVQPEDEKISWRLALAFIVRMTLSANM